MAEVAQVCTVNSDLTDEVTGGEGKKKKKETDKPYRYSAFIVLYPPGLISEAWLVYLALTTTSGVSLPYQIYLFLGFLTYIPGALKEASKQHETF